MKTKLVNITVQAIATFLKALRWYLTDNGAQIVDPHALIPGGWHTYIELFRKPRCKVYEVVSVFNWGHVDSDYKHRLREQIQVSGFILREV